MDRSKQAKDIDEYIEMYPEDVQVRLKQLRKVIRESISPKKVEETISYKIPAFKLNGQTLVYFGAFKDHIAFFPTSSGREAFGKELSKYKGGRGTIQFPNDEPIPLDLVKKITKYRVKETMGIPKKEKKGEEK